MKPMSAHEDLKEFLGAYALDALEPDEAAEVEEHLPGCAECRAEVAEHREVASLFSDVSMEPPADVWERIVEQLDAEPAPSAQSARPAGPEAGKPIKPHRTVSLRWAAALAAAAVVAIAALSIAVVRLDQRKSGPSTSQAALQQAAHTALTTPGAKRTTLRSSDGRLSIDVVILPDGKGYLVSNDLPPLPNGQTYQLWAQSNNQLVSFGVLGESPGVVPFRVESPVIALAVTNERAGGVPAPTRQPLLSGLVPHG